MNAQQRIARASIMRDRKPSAQQNNDRGRFERVEAARETLAECITEFKPSQSVVRKIERRIDDDSITLDEIEEMCWPARDRAELAACRLDRS